jgi:hypothetical protein
MWLFSYLKGASVDLCDSKENLYDNFSTGLPYKMLTHLWFVVHVMKYFDRLKEHEY